MFYFGVIRVFMTVVGTSAVLCDVISLITIRHAGSIIERIAENENVLKK